MFKLTGSFVTDTITAIIRHVATATGGMLVADGVMKGSDLNAFVGSVCFLVGLTWSIYQKYGSTQTK